MDSPETFVSELEGKNQSSIERLLQGFDALIREQELSLTALLKLEARHTVEMIEATALWIADSGSLPYKVALASYAGACAQRFELIGARLAALGVAVEDFDPVALGYSKLFGFLRSLQTVEERAAGGPLTVGVYAVERYRVIAALARLQADEETAHVFSTTLCATELEAIHAGRTSLLASARNEESQARSRRAAFRAIELLGEIQEPAVIRKFLGRSQRRASQA